MDQITPVIDTKVLQEKANEYAQKGAEETMKEFYSGYSSPYRAAIREQLENKGIDSNFDIPDIVANINEELSNQVSKIANQAIAESFVPLVAEVLTREPVEVLFSDFLKKIVEHSNFAYNDLDPEDYLVEFLQNEESFTRINISFGENSYDIGFFNFDKKLPFKEREWKLYSLPSVHDQHSTRTMKLSLEGGALLELPFVPNVLHDKVVAYCARILIGKSKIKFDTENFDEDMFPKDECHC